MDANNLGRLCAIPGLAPIVLQEDLDESTQLLKCQKNSKYETILLQYGYGSIKLPGAYLISGFLEGAFS